MDTQTRTELEAAAFRRLLEHLRHRTDVQNVDLMGWGGFCRNCLADWYREAAEAKGVTMEIIYGMPYEDWRAKYQTKASPEQLARMDASIAKNKGH
jgi:hypothetical protein